MLSHQKNVTEELAAILANAGIAQWQIVSGYPFYAVSSNGDVRSLRTGRMLAHALTIDGYHQVKLYQNKVSKNMSVSRLVLSHFDRVPADNEVCDHIDNDPDNNAVSNLRWVTQKMNVANSRFLQENRQGAKFKNTAIVEVFRLFIECKSIKATARFFGTTTACIRKILLGETYAREYARLTDDIKAVATDVFNANAKCRSFIFTADPEKVKQAHRALGSVRATAKYFGVADGTVTKVLKL